MSQILFFAIPNGAKVSASQASKLKAEGMEPGIPDLFFPELRLFIEFKRPASPGKAKGTLSKDQKIVIKELRRVGYTVAVCYTCEQAQKVIKSMVNIRN